MAGGRDASRCTHSSHRCHHAAHAYTGVPCSTATRRSKARKLIKKSSFNGAAMLPRIDNSKRGSGAAYRELQNFSLNSVYFLGSRGKEQPVTLQLKQGGNVQALRLPTEKLEPNKKYYVTFTLKPKENGKHQFENYQRQSVY